MSEKICNTVNKIGEKSNCPMCRRNLSTPKTLFCLHTFCQQCLEGLPIDPKRNLSCPTCQSPCELPATGVAGLPTAFFVENVTEINTLLRRVTSREPVMCSRCQTCTASSYCKQCAVFACTGCSQLQHGELDSHEDHVIVDIDEIANAVSGVFESDMLMCSAHDRPLNRYCDDCQLLVCDVCCVRVHRRHCHNEINDVFPDCLRLLESTCNSIEQNINSLNDIIPQLCQRKSDIMNNGQLVKEEIDSTVSGLIKILKDHQRKLNSTVDSVMNKKINTISGQMVEATSTLSSLEDCHSYMREALTHGTQQQILANKQQMLTHSKDLLECCSTKSFAPLEEPDLELFKKVTADTKLLNSVCRVKYHLNQIPQTITCKYSHLPLVGVESTVHLTMTDANGLYLPIPVSNVYCYLDPPNSRGFTRHTLTESTSPGCYNLTFTPFTRGVHTVRVCVRGNETGMCPLASIPVSIPPRMRGMPIDVIPDLEKPWGIDCSDNGHIVVSEWESACSMFINYDDGMKKRKYLGECGSDFGQFNRPSGVCFTDRNTYLISDTGNNRIQEIKRSGECITSIGKRGSGKLEFKFPRGIAFDKKTQRIFVADDENHRIQVLNSDLSHALSFGHHGSSLGQFNRPRDIVFDSTGNLYVTDVDNHRVQKFSPQGEFLMTLGTRGSRQGQLCLPVGITIDDRDYLYVAESGNRRVSVFAPNGDFVYCFNGWGGKEGGRLHDPREISFDKQGHLYVCDWGNNSVMVF